MSCVACLDRELDVTYCGFCGERIADRDPRLGRVLAGRYRLVERIATGGFGSVYRAVAHGGEVAVKVLHDADADTRVRFRREAAAMASLANPHVVATLELGEDRDGTCFIAMELLRGETLAQRLSRRGPLPWQATLAIVRDIAGALVEAHARGVVHRDLKPANVVLVDEPPDFVKVLDFGIAKIARGSALDDGAELTRTGQLIGTPLYMSPEQRAGGCVDPRTDLYALGVIAYELITGLRPFSLASPLTRPPPPSSIASCPPEIDDVILRCLEVDANLRFPDAVAFLAAIDRACEPITVVAKRPLAPVRRGTERQLPRRNVTSIAMAIAALYGLGVGLGMALGIAI